MIITEREQVKQDGQVVTEQEYLTCSMCDGSGVVDVEPATARLLMGSVCDDCGGEGRVPA